MSSENWDSGLNMGWWAKYCLVKQLSPRAATIYMYNTSWQLQNTRVLSSGGELPPKLPSFPPNVACCEPYIALNCVSGDLKFKIFWGEPPDSLT